MNETYKAFLQQENISAAPSKLVGLYHAVRNIPYGSTGIRDPEQVIQGNLGSCSGKHLALRDMLRHIGHEAEIITIYTHFNKRIPVVESFPDELKRMCREEQVPDFHHYVRVATDDGWIKLDATWHDALIPYGFTVNDKWNGTGDTVLAGEPIREYPAVEDLIPYKIEMIASLPESERKKRERFFGLITDWIATL